MKLYGNCSFIPVLYFGIDHLRNWSFFFLRWGYGPCFFCVTHISCITHNRNQTVTCFFQPIVLEGHHKAVTAQALSHRERPTLLCSCSDDYIIVWNINKARTAVENGDFIILKFIYNFLVLKVWNTINLSDISQQIHFCTICFRWSTKRSSNWYNTGKNSVLLL